MENQIEENLITVSERTVRREGGMVILPLREYKDLCEMAMPAYRLEGKEAKELDRLVENGLKEHKKGRTVKASSLSEALKIYERKQHKKH